MPGGYAHLTLINQMRGVVDADDDMPVSVKIAYGDNQNFCDLGGVSPDYPYLDALNSDSPPWADLMHYTNTTDVIRAAARRIWDLSGQQQSKCLAWLLGYAAHVVGDMTIHPIVELKVGPYEHNKTDHRVCEMHQDAHIFQRLGLGKVGLAEYLDKEQNGLRACHRPGDENRIDADVFAVWDGALADVHPGHHAQNPPDIDAWHAHFGGRVDLIEEGASLPEIARHVAVNSGLTYPEPDEIAYGEYIDALQTPEGAMHYDDILKRTLNNIAEVWTRLGRAVDSKQIDELNTLGDWNLDTGRDQATGTYVYWSTS